MHGTEALEEADRLMTVCNSCRYCEGLCAVFPAMEMRRSFPDGDLNYLANLCHSCGACYVDCQFSPPHEFNVNVPKNLAVVREDSFAAYAWPRFTAPLFKRNELTLVGATALGVCGFLLGFIAFDGSRTAFGAHHGPGAFYVLMPHVAMVLLFSIVFILALFAVSMSVLAFWRGIGETAAELRAPRAILEAAHDAATLRYLDGGGVGCYNVDDKPTDRRRLFHHLTFYGFLLCFAATCVATIYHYLGYEAPYAWWEPPVVLGTVGGLALVIGCAGLFLAKRRRDPAMVDGTRRGMDDGFIAMLFLTGLSGLALLAFRGTPAMGMLLAIHLGFVFGFFVTIPYGKFVHGFYRFAALMKYSKERRAFLEAPGEGTD